MELNNAIQLHPCRLNIKDAFIYLLNLNFRSCMDVFAAAEIRHCCNGHPGVELYLLSCKLFYVELGSYG
jgi:hypothetical protein